MPQAYEAIADDLRRPVRAGERAPGDRRTGHGTRRDVLTRYPAESAPFGLVTSRPVPDLIAVDVRDTTLPGGRDRTALLVPTRLERW